MERSEYPVLLDNLLKALILFQLPVDHFLSFSPLLQARISTFITVLILLDLVAMLIFSLKLKRLKGTVPTHRGIVSKIARFSDIITFVFLVYRFFSTDSFVYYSLMILFVLATSFSFANQIRSFRHKES